MNLKIISKLIARWEDTNFSPFNEKNLLIVHPSGKPISPHLLRYETFAVADYSCMSHALHLRQTQLVKSSENKDLKGDFGAEPSNKIRQRVAVARAMQSHRLARTKIYCNAQMSSRHIKKHCQIDEVSDSLLESAIDKLGLSARAYKRILKIARTIADLDGAADIRVDHISEAVQYRTLDRAKGMA